MVSLAIEAFAFRALKTIAGKMASNGVTGLNLGLLWPVSLLRLRRRQCTSAFACRVSYGGRVGGQVGGRSRLRPHCFIDGQF